MRFPLQEMTVAFGFIALLLFVSVPALGMGALCSRPIDSTSNQEIAPCGTGRLLVEELFEGGNVRGSWSRYVLACLRGPQTADWVLISAAYFTPCESDDAECYPSDALPDFRDTELDGSTVPYVARLNLVKYGLGYGCAIISQPVIPPEHDKWRPLSVDRWLCDRINLFDGRYQGSGEASVLIDQPARYRSVRLETRSSIPLSSDDPIELVDSFIVPDDNYTLYLRYLEEDE